MVSNLKVGIIGFGGAGMAQLWHFNQMTGCRVTAIYDPKPDGLRRATLRAPDAFATPDFNAFMASGINTVAVCSPDSTHADYVVAAIDAGLHVISEKPLTDSLEGCRRVLNASTRARGVVAAVQHQMRCLPVHLEMKKMIRSGELGRISYLEGYYVHNLTERAFLYDNWRATDNATPLVYSGCHFVDLLRWLLDDEVEEVIGMANHLAFPKYPESDLNVVLLRFKSGVIGKVVVAFGAGRPQDHSVRVYGSEMSLENNLLFSKSGDYRVFCRPHLAKHEPSIVQNEPPFYHLRGHHYRARLRRYIDAVSHLLVRKTAGRSHEAQIARSSLWYCDLPTALVPSQSCRSRFLGKLCCGDSRTAAACLYSKRFGEDGCDLSRWCRSLPHRKEHQSR